MTFFFERQQHSSRLLPAVYWPCFTRNIFFIQSLTHLLYPTMKNINISTKTPKKSSFYRRNNKIFQTICFAFANACAVRSTYSFLYVWFGLSQSLRFLPKDRRLGSDFSHWPNDWSSYSRYIYRAHWCTVASSAGLSKGSSLRIGFEKKFFWERGPVLPFSRKFPFLRKF